MGIAGFLLPLLLLVLAVLAVLAVVPGRAGGGARPVGAPDLPSLRRHYAAAATDEAAARRMLAAVRGYDGPNAAIVGYRAVAEAVQARYVWSPLAKLRAVRAAQKTFDHAVALDARNVEVRFLRYTIEVNVPRYLGLSAHLAADRALIIAGARHYPDLGLDAQSLTIIRDFMLQRGECTPEETRMLRAIAP